MPSITTQEDLRETLLDLELARQREEWRRIETEILLGGLQALTEPGQSAKEFGGLLKTMCNDLAVEAAFILTLGDTADTLVVLSTTDPRLVGTRWPIDATLQRALDGRPARSFDVNRVAAWQAQDANILADLGSAIYVSFDTPDGPAVLVCASRARGFFTTDHEHLLTRLKPLATQVLAHIRMREAEARAAAEAADAAKTRFLASMSHELRTPLNAIIGFSEMIKDAYVGPLDAHYRDYASDIHDSGIHLLGLLNNVLDLTKIDVGEFEIREASFEVNREIERTRMMMLTKAAEKNVRVVFNPPSRLYRLYLHGDAQAFRQIVLNLLANAIKFAPSDDTVTITIERSKTAFEVAVSDHGPGIPEAIRDKVFSPFYQGSNASYLHHIEGSGLGLSLVKAFAEAHGGEARIDGSFHPGTRVVVSFPGRRILDNQGEPREPTETSASGD